MKKYWYIAVCLSGCLKGTVEIDNKSSLPFRITQLVYDQNDGIGKTPNIDFTGETVPPYSTKHLGSRKMITEVVGVYAGKSYTFKFFPHAENMILISADNTITTLGPSPAPEYGIHTKLPENYKPIVRL